MICSPIGAAASFVTIPGIVTTSILGGIILKLAGDMKAQNGSQKGFV